jgi:hypothetical protein
MSDPGFISVVCDCGARLRFPESKASQRLPCPKCRKLVDVPDEDELVTQNQQVDLVEEPKPEAVAPTVTCACGAQMRFREELRGKKIRCPKCKAAVPVPEADEPAPPPSDSPDAPAWEPAVKPDPPMSVMDWLPFLAASAILCLEAFALGPAIPFVLATKIPESTGIAFAGFGQIAIGIVAAIQAAVALVALLYLCRADAARAIIVIVSIIMVLLNGVAFFFGGGIWAVINLVVFAAIIFAFRGEAATRYCSGGGIPRKLSMGLTAGVALIALILGWVGYSATSRLLEQFATYDTLITSIDKAKTAVASADPADEKAKRAASLEANRVADAADREGEALRELVGDRAWRLLQLKADLLRLNAHMLDPLGPGAWSALKARIKRDVAAARSAPTGADKRGLMDLERAATLLEEELGAVKETP